MSNQIVISSGAKVRELEGVLTGTAGIVNALSINVPNGIPQLDSNGKILVNQLPNSVMEYKGTWNVSTNTPTLVNGVGNQGDVYLVEGAAVGGTAFNFGAGPIIFFNGDQVVYSGSIWQRASGSTGTVTSVAVTESGDALSITGSPITTSGTINIGFTGNSGQYVNGAGGLTTFPTDNITGSGASGQVTYFNGTNTITGENSFNYDASTNRLGVNTTVPNATIGANAGTDSGYSLLLKNDNANYNGIGFGTDSTYGNLIATEKLGTAPARNLTLLNQSGYISITEVGNLGVNILNPNTGLDIYNGTSSYLWLHTANSGITGTDGVRLALFSTNTANLRNFEGAMSITSEGDFSVITLGDENFRVNSSDGSIYQAKVPNAMLKSVSGVITAAVAGTDYVVPSALSAYVPYTGATTNVNLGTFDLTADVITGATGSFASSGSGNTFAINHSSGSGIALNITKGGNGEGLYINKTSGSGNAATIIGTLNATTIVKDGGTSSQYLMADGSVTTSAGFITGSGVDGRVPYFNGTSSITSEAGFIYDSSTNRLGVNTSVPNATIGADASLNSGYGLLIKTGASDYNGIGIAIDSTYGNTIEAARLGSAPSRNLTLLNVSGYVSLTETGAFGVGILNPNNGIDIYNSTQSQLWLHNAATGITATDGVRLVLFNSKEANLRNFDGGLSITAEGDFSIITIGAENFRINSANGFVGIGNPASLPSMLTVNGGATITGLTTGQILFPTSGGTLSGSSSLFWDNTNAKLGLGTTTLSGARLTITSVNEAEHLHLVANAPALTFTNALSLTYYAGIGMATASNNFVTGAVQGDLALGAFNTSSILFYNNNTNTMRMSLNGSGAAIFSGSVTARGPKSQIVVDGNSVGAAILLTNSIVGVNRRNWLIGTEENVEGDFVIERSTTSGGTPNTPVLSLSRDGAATFSSSVSLGNTTAASTTTPINISLGGTFGTTLANGTKIKVFESGGTAHGVGVIAGNLYLNTNDGSTDITLNTNNSERMRITSGGNVGIGTSSPAYRLHVSSTASEVMRLQGTSGGGSNNTQLRFFGSASNADLWAIGTEVSTGSSDRAFDFYDLVAGANRMRITSGGQLQIKQGSDTSSDGLRLINNTFANRWTIVNGGDNNLYLLWNEANRGTFNFATGVYTALSDISKKKDFEQSTIGLNAILGLKPTLYRMKSDDTEGNKELGFIAQEVKEFIPQAYVESGVENKFIGLNYNAIVAALVKSIQELESRIKQLENK